MNLAVQRIALTGLSTCGNLFIDNALECWTLEEPHASGLPGSCIAAGTYGVTLGPSPKFLNSTDPWERNMGQCIPHVNNVPNRSAILIHWGNTAKDTEGCILVGLSHQVDFIGQSRDAFKDLITKMITAANDGESITLEVVDPPSVGSSS
jgi:hypothetical protein